LKPETRPTPQGTEPAPARRAGRWVSLGTELLWCLALAALNLAAWRWANPPLVAAQAPLPIAGLAYNGFQRWQSPLQQQWPGTDELAADLRVLARFTGHLRTYSASEVPQLVDLARS